MGHDAVHELPVLGALPPDWAVVVFVSILADGTRNGIYKPKEFHGTGIKIVNMGELFGNPRLYDVPMKRVQLSSDELARFGLQVGDLLFARRSLVAEGAGKCSIVLEIEEPTTFESSIIRARPNPDVVDSSYLYYLFRSPYGSYVLDSITRQVAVAGITGKDLENLPIPLPSLSEQRAIARILGALDDKIEINRRMNETLEAIARALFQSWFVDFDPVRATAEGRQPAGMHAEAAALFPDAFEESNLGPIPQGWRIGQFVALANITYGFPFKSTYFNQEAGVPVVRIRDLANHFSPTLTTESFDRQYVVEAGDVLIGMDGEFRAYYWQGDPALLNQRVCRVRPANVRIPQPYLYFAIQAPLARIEGSQVGTTVIHLGKKEIDLIEVVLPSHGVLEVFGDMTKSLFDLMVVNSKQSRTLAATRDALLPKLLSGEVRVEEAEKMVKAAI
jgi:type I restriction enzyme, S subunit